MLGRSNVWSLGAAAVLVCVVAAGASAQPDPRQMSGIPRPDPNLSDGSITVRVIRGSFANNVVDHPVDLLAGDAVSTAVTDAEGRASFSSLSPGSQVRVATMLDGQTLESQPFSAPGRGGVAVMLVGALPGADPEPPRVPGTVTLGGDSRILIELGEEVLEVYYLLDVVNLADSPVEPQPAFEFSFPSGAQSTTALQGSSPRTLIDGPNVSVAGGFQPGVTPVRVAYILPYGSGEVAVSQAFPAAFDQLLVFIEKWGGIEVDSTLIDRRGEMGEDQTGASALLWAAGNRVAAGQPVTLEFTGLPHHPGWPRILTLSLSGLILLAGGIGASGGTVPDADAVRQAQLERRREKLFTELAKVERQHREGKSRPTRYGTRRAELVGQLERVLRDLDTGPVPDPAS
jgi:hypothetical protein